ncbi:MAG: phospholipase D-like domain-containing protein [Gemmatimonadota bacterium]|nr:phospholipase D-like domain-containing protein [Gemmatimonadota bacterium]
MLLLLWLAGMWRGVSRALPPGVSTAAPFRTADIEFLADVTYQRAGAPVHERSIFQHVFEMIDEADRFVVVDMFLFDGEHAGDREYVALSSLLADRLLARKASVRGLAVTFITDEINNFYGAYQSDLVERLKAGGVQVVITDLTKLRDSNPAYSSIWRMVFRWFGTAGPGLVPHPLSSTGRRVTLRSYLKMLNFKANHRKLIVTDEACLVASANPHDASSFHSNIAFATHGTLCADILESERAVAAFSGAVIPPHVIDDASEHGGSSTVQLVTEGEIRTQLVDVLDATGVDDSIDVAMFYLSDREVIEALERAARRGAHVRLMLDPNKDAFGREKGGVPNRQVARELRRSTDGAVEVRWFDTHGEQFHTKLVRVTTRAGTTIMGGSANLTRRNIGDYNLEADLMIVPDSALDATVAGYFDRLWTNRDGQFTVDFSAYDDPSLLKRWQYRVQEFTGLSSF